MVYIKLQAHVSDMSELPDPCQSSSHHHRAPRPQFSTNQNITAMRYMSDWNKMMAPKKMWYGNGCFLGKKGHTLHRGCNVLFLFCEDTKSCSMCLGSQGGMLIGSQGRMLIQQSETCISLVQNEAALWYKNRAKKQRKSQRRPNSLKTWLWNVCGKKHDV